MLFLGGGGWNREYWRGGGGGEGVLEERKIHVYMSTKCLRAEGKKKINTHKNITHYPLLVLIHVAVLLLLLMIVTMTKTIIMVMIIIQKIILHRAVWHQLYPHSAVYIYI